MNTRFERRRSVWVRLRDASASAGLSALINCCSALASAVDCWRRSSTLGTVDGCGGGGFVGIEGGLETAVIDDEAAADADVIVDAADEADDVDGRWWNGIGRGGGCGGGDE